MGIFGVWVGAVFLWGLCCSLYTFGHSFVGTFFNQICLLTSPKKKKKKKIQISYYLLHKLGLIFHSFIRVLVFFKVKNKVNRLKMRLNIDNNIIKFLCIPWNSQS